MTRFADADNQTAVEQPHVPYVLLAEFDFASGFVRVNSADRYFTHNGQQFAPLGTFAGISPVKENGNLSPEKMEFTLSGVDTSLIGTTLTENYHDRDARLWVGYLDESCQLLAEPHLLWEGVMENMLIRREQNSALISVVCENRLIRWNDAADWLYTFEHQRVFDPTDDFLDQVQAIANKEVKWGDMTYEPVEGPGRPPYPKGPRV